MNVLNSLPDYVKSLPIVVLNTLVIYVLLILAFRILGRRQLGQLTVIDLVIIIVMGSAVETALIGGNLSLPAGLVSAATLLGADRLCAYVFTKSKRLRHLLGGGPSLLIHYGHYVEDHIRRAGLTLSDVDQAVHARGYQDIAEVKFGVLEEDGEINIVPMTEPVLTGGQPVNAHVACRHELPQSKHRRSS